MKCKLCKEETHDLIYFRNRKYLRCKSCKSIMMDSNYYISSKKEKERYQEHNNDVNDKGYQKFVSPIVNNVLEDYGKTHIGLDFGSGTGPVITKLLRDNSYNINVYDPFFANNKEKLEKQYDYIVCCEVAEHFHNPSLEFKRLKSMLKARGSLYLMTGIYDEDIDFERWTYKNDPTHVFFYHKKALEYIKEKYDFSEIVIDGNMIIYRSYIDLKS